MQAACLPPFLQAPYLSLKDGACLPASSSLKNFLPAL